MGLPALATLASATTGLPVTAPATMAAALALVALPKSPIASAILPFSLAALASLASLPALAALSTLPALIATTRALLARASTAGATLK